jgi:hypothetical protein
MRPFQLGDIDRADQWTIKTVPQRMDSLSADPWMISTARTKGSRPRCDVQVVRAAEPRVVRIHLGFSAGLRLLALRLEPVVDQPLCRL